MAGKSIVLLGVLTSVLSASTLFVFCVVNGATSSRALEFVASFGYADVGPIAPRFVPMIKGHLIASVCGILVAVLGLAWVMFSSIVLMVFKTMRRLLGS